MSTKIEWAEETFNPIIGCSKISDGCTNCWAEKMAFRIANMQVSSPYLNVIKGEKWAYFKNPKHGWNGKTHLIESALEKPLKWKKPRRIFVCSMGDLFHESVEWNWITKVCRVIEKCPQHTFLFLTKRPERMKTYFFDVIMNYHHNPFKNLWIGVTAENQEQADNRIPILLQIPAAKRFVSIEPMLGRVDLTSIQHSNEMSINVLTGEMQITTQHRVIRPTMVENLDWVIIGSESGPKRRECKEEWVIDLIQQCEVSDVPVMVKQLHRNGKKVSLPEINGKIYNEYPV